MKYSDFIEKAKFNKEYIIQGFKKVGMDKRAERIDSCGLYKYFALCDDCYTLHFNGAMTCKDKFCAVCNKKRSLLWLARMKPIFEHYMANKQKVVFVTFTIKNVERLQNGVDMLQKAFRYMTHDSKYYAKQFSFRFFGGVRSMEVKRGAGDGLWHPHFHCLFVKSDNSSFKSDFDFLRDAWEHSLRVVTDTLDVNAKLGSVFYEAIKAGYTNEGVKAILETFGYCTKFDWQNSDDILELVDCLKGVRMINTFGSIRKLLSAKKIELDMDKSLTDISICRCSICGGNHFTEFASSDFKHNHAIIHDFAEDVITGSDINVTMVKEPVHLGLYTMRNDVMRNNFLACSRVFSFRKFLSCKGLTPIKIDSAFINTIFKPKIKIEQIKFDE